jgi:hypothetical protein
MALFLLSGVVRIISAQVMLWKAEKKGSEGTGYMHGFRQAGVI